MILEKPEEVLKICLFDFSGTLGDKWRRSPIIIIVFII